MSPNPLLKLFIHRARDIFAERAISLYTFGSLGEHGDFSSCSDVDVVLLLDKLQDVDEKTILELWDEIKKSGLDYADRLSLFWSSYEGDDFASGRGRFPPLDRLDLIRHAKLLYGKDHRHELQEPTQKELVLESANFISTFMLADGKFDQLVGDANTILLNGARYFTKFVLFPVRLLFTVKNEKTIASNKDAVAYFNRVWTEKLSNDVVALVNFAYQTRSCPASEPVSYDIDTLQPALQELYKLVISEYILAADNFGDTQCAKQLRNHLEKIDKAIS